MLFVLAGSTARAFEKVLRRYSNTFHTLPDNVPKYCPASALITVSSR